MSLNVRFTRVPATLGNRGTGIGFVRYCNLVVAATGDPGLLLNVRFTCRAVPASLGNQGTGRCMLLAKDLGYSLLLLLPGLACSVRPRSKPKVMLPEGPAEALFRRKPERKLKFNRIFYIESNDLNLFQHLAVLSEIILIRF